MPAWGPILPSLSFVGDTASNPTTVANLLATWPAGAAYLGKYARVMDLWASADEVMRCSSDGATYYWRPQRTDYAVSQATTGGSMSLVPLVNPPTIYLSGTLGSNLTMTPSATNAWPGAQFNVTSIGVLGLFGISVTGLLGGTLPILGGGTRTLTYTTAGWRGV